MATRIMEELPISEPTEIQDWVERFQQYSVIHEAILTADSEAAINSRKVALYTVK